MQSDTCTQYSGVGVLSAGIAAGVGAGQPLRRGLVNGDDRVTVAELVKAVNSALNGCVY